MGCCAKCGNFFRIPEVWVVLGAGQAVFSGVMLFLYFQLYPVSPMVPFLWALACIGWGINSMFLWRAWQRWKAGQPRPAPKLIRKGGSQASIDSQASASSHASVGSQASRSLRKRASGALSTTAAEPASASPEPAEEPARKRPYKPLRFFAGLAVMVLQLIATIWIITEATMYTNTIYRVPHHGLRFARLGGASPTELQVILRDPEQADGFHVYYRPFDATVVTPVPDRRWALTLTEAGADPADWTLHPEPLVVRPEVDFTGHLTISGLSPATSYLVALAPRTGAAPPTEVRLSWSATNLAAGEVLVRQTAPEADEQAVPVSFSFGSCNLPHFPRHSPMTGLGAVSDWPVDFHAHLGDLIYSDHPYRHSSTPPFHHYVHNYRHFFQDYFGLAYASSAPLIAVWDDHEIYNNWDAGLYDPAWQAWQAYLANGNPVQNRTYFSMDWGSDVSLFFMDTRSFRSPSSSTDDENKTMLGEEQLREFKAWIDSDRGTVFRFVMSGVPFSIAYRDSDVWFGFQTERQKILGWLQEAYAAGKGRPIVLTGDRHEVGVMKLTRGTGGACEEDGVPQLAWWDVTSHAEAEPCATKGAVMEFSASPMHGFNFGFGSAIFRSPKPSIPVDYVDEILFKAGNQTSYAGMIEYVPDDQSVLVTLSLTPRQKGFPDPDSNFSQSAEEQARWDTEPRSWGDMPSSKPFIRYRIEA